MPLEHLYSRNKHWEGIAYKPLFGSHPLFFICLNRSPGLKHPELLRCANFNTLMLLSRLPVPKLLAKTISESIFHPRSRSLNF